MDEFVDGARLADELAATAEMRAVVFRVHAREAALSARMTRSVEARLLYEALCDGRQQTAQLLSQKASYLRKTARLLAEAGAQDPLPNRKAWSFLERRREHDHRGVGEGPAKRAQAPR